MADINVGNISDVSGSLNIAGGNIINKIQTIYERALTPGEVAERDLQIEVNELARCVREHLDRLTQQLAAPSSSEPYKGLAAYTFSEAQLFFGRDQAIRDLRQAMKRNPLTILQAESGAGKTSLLQAGILPQVIAGGQLAILVRPGTGHPTEAIKDIFIGDPDLTPRLSKAPLVDFLRRVSTIIGYQTTLYLILDQFEEFFSKATLEQDRQEFVEDLAACLNDTTLNVRWLISITTDAFGQLGKFEPQIRNPFSNVQSLYLFTRKEAADVIARPAEKNGLSFEEGLLDRLLDDLDQNHLDAIAPTQIQLVCAALYDDIKEKETHFTRECYDQRNGAQGILRNYLSNTLNQKLPQSERVAAYKIFETLVTSEKKRLIRRRAELDLALKGSGLSPEMLDVTLNHLVTSRLLRRLGDDEQNLQYEIVHDYLLGEIEIDPGVISTKQTEELLEDGLKAWRRNRTLLLTQDHLNMIEGLYGQSPWRLNEEMAEFLTCSAAVNNRSLSPWLEGLSQPRIAGIVSHAISDLKSSNPTVRRTSRQVAWAMRANLPSNTYRMLYMERLLRKSWVLIPVFLIAALLLQPIKNWLSYPEASGWERLPSFEQQTQADLQNLSLSVNLENPDDVYASDRTMGVLFMSQDGGKHWQKTISNSMQASVVALSSAVGERLYALTKDAVWISNDQGKSWRATGPIGLTAEEMLLSIAVNPRNPQELHVGGNLGRLYRTTDAGQHWTLVSDPGYLGQHIKALATNGNVLVLATEEGLWAYLDKTNHWNQLSLHGCSGDKELASQVSALAIPYPFDDPDPPLDQAIGFWAVIPGTGICDSNVMPEFGTSPYYSTSGPLSTIAATGQVALGSNAYLGSADEVLRSRTWFSNNLEWWKIKFHALISKRG